MRFSEFVGGTYQSWSNNVCDERSINFFPEIVESAGGKVRVALHSTPGLNTFSTLPKAPVRALFAGEDRLFAVGGDTLYEVFIDATFSAIGAVGDDPSHTPAQISANGLELMIVSADHAWIATGTSVVPAPVPADDAAPAGTPANTVGTARTGCFLDSYFIAAKPDSKRFFFSNSYQGTVWDVLEQSQKEGYPDNIASMVADHEELWLFGSHHATEVWRNEGDEGAAGGFRRDPSGFVQMATVAPWSIVSMAQGLHFLGGDTNGRVIAYRAQGFMPVRVSNHAVEQIWNDYDTVWDAYAYTYTESGHQFWVLNFMTANATWVYDVASQMWHERGDWDGTTLTRHRGRCHAFVFGKNFVGDWENGKIYEMSQDIYNNDGAPIYRIRQAPHLANEQKALFHHRLELDLHITGALPSVAMQWSDDDGATWTTPKVRTPDPANKTKGQVVWNRLGRAIDRIYRVTISDAVKVAIADAFIEADPATIARPEPKAR